MRISTTMNNIWMNQTMFCLINFFFVVTKIIPWEQWIDLFEIKTIGSMKMWKWERREKEEKGERENEDLFIEKSFIKFIKSFIGSFFPLLNYSVLRNKQSCSKLFWVVKLLQCSNTVKAKNL